MPASTNAPSTPQKSRRCCSPGCYLEVLEHQQEDEQVVDAERVLDDVGGEELEPALGAPRTSQSPTPKATDRTPRAAPSDAASDAVCARCPGSGRRRGPPPAPRSTPALNSNHTHHGCLLIRCRWCQIRRPAQHHHRPIHDGQLATGGSAYARLSVAVGGVDQDLPVAAPLDVGEREVHRLVVGVHEDEQRVAHHLARRARRGWRWRRRRGGTPATRTKGWLPVLLGHLAAVRPEPGQVLEVRVPDVLAAEEAAPLQHRLLDCRSRMSRRVNSSSDLLPLVQVPVHPGELVVLAVGVVVAALGPADLVAGQQHRHALRDEERGEEVAHLPLAQRVDRRVVGLALRRRSSRSRCRPRRPGCPRRSPRCACGCR